jgi:hypothetical protein
MSLLIDDPRGLLNIESPDTREGESLVLREVFRGWIGDVAGTNASLNRDPAVERISDMGKSRT